MLVNHLQEILIPKPLYAVQIWLTNTNLSITGVTWRTGTLKATNGVSANGSSATTSVVCSTFVDIYIIKPAQIFLSLKDYVAVESVHSWKDYSVSYSWNDILIW